MRVADLIEVLQTMPADALVVNAFEGGLALPPLTAPRLGRGVLFADGTVDEGAPGDARDVVFFE